MCAIVFDHALEVGRLCDMAADAKCHSSKIPLASRTGSMSRKSANTRARSRHGIPHLLAQRIDDHHRRSDRAGALESGRQVIGQKDCAETLSLTVLHDSQPADQDCAHKRIARVAPPAASGTSPYEIAITRSVVTKLTRWLVSRAEHEQGIRLQTNIPVAWVVRSRSRLSIPQVKPPRSRPSLSSTI